MKRPKSGISGDSRPIAVTRPRQPATRTIDRCALDSELFDLRHGSVSLRAVNCYLTRYNAETASKLEVCAMISSDCIVPSEEVREPVPARAHLDHVPLDRWDFAWLLAIGIVGLGLRLIYVTQYTAHPLGRVLYVDEVVYWERAHAILTGSWLPDRPFYQDPLIHYVLAGLMSVVGKDVSTLRLTLACAAR